MTLAHLHLSPHASADLGFDEVQRVLSSLCSSIFGREAIASDVFPDDESALDARVEEAMEACAAIERKVTPDFGGLREIRHVLDAADKGVVLGAIDILEVARTVDAISRLHDLIVEQQDDAPRLSSLAARLADERRFSRRVLRSFDEQGQLTDDASPELAAARARVRALRAEAQDKLVGLVREFDDVGFLRDRNFTIRNDRYVLPVKSEYQGRVEGIVHDASQTHQTVFVEPRALLQIGNRIKIARADVEQEEARILAAMSQEVAELGPRLLVDLDVAGQLEASFARGRFARAVDGIPARASSRGELELRGARHPLLSWMRAQALAQGAPAASVVANDVVFGGARALIISGPNAGGKTVALKTAGLIALMARAGIPVPVDAGSAVPFFAAIVVSIGDEQSLMGALSTFSGHLTGVQQILRDAREHVARGPVLCLLDELMAGTDPAQGAALGQAVLEDLVLAGVCVVVTTHYDRLKALAVAEQEGVDASGGAAPSSAGARRARRFRNASVGVDPRSGRPTFVLTLDEVGTSNALEAARRYGLPDDVVARAEQLLAPEQKELHALLRVLAEQKGALQARVAEALAEKERWEDEGRKLERKLVEVERERARLRAEGKKAFLGEIEAARLVVKDAIEAAKAKEPRALNAASHALQQLEQQTRADVEPQRPRTSELMRPRTVKVGDVVELAHMPGSRMTVLEVDGDAVVVGRGPVRTRAALDALRAPGDDDARARASDKAAGRSAARSAGRGRAKSAATASSTGQGSSSEPRTSDNSLDLRGRRADEAFELIDAFLDKLMHAGRTRGFILHGHGTGALKKVVRDALAQSRYVAHAEPASHEDGGDAWTAVQLADG